MTSNHRFAITTFLGASILVPILCSGLAIASLSACAPKDEKVSNRNGFNSGSGFTDARMDDRVSEYSRSMLIELADVARQAEGVFQAASNVGAGASATAVATGDSSTPAVAAQALKTSDCKIVSAVASPTNTLKFNVESKGCKENGATFAGTQYGHEMSMGTFTKVEGQPALVTMLKVEGKGIETVLKPNGNPKDTLRVKSYRFLDAQLVSEAGGDRLYRFSYENYGTYSLNLKAFLDNGSITSKLSGVLVYNIASGRVSAFRAPEPSDRLNLKVESARQGRNGGKLVSQEFYGSGVVRELAVDLATCALPIGIVTSRFTVRPSFSEDKKYTLDSSTVINSFEDHVINTQKADVSKAKISAKLCSTEEAITMTEFYAGLLY